MDKDSFDQIQKFLELPDLNYKSKADFVTKAVQEKLEEEAKKLASDEDHRIFYNELKKLNEDNKKLRGEFKDVKKGLQAVTTMYRITQQSAAINNPLNESMKKQLLKTFGEDKLRESIDKEVKYIQDSGLTEDEFARIIKKHTKEFNKEVEKQLKKKK